MRRRRFAVGLMLLLFGFLVATSPADAAIYYVSVSGSNANAGTSAGSPFATLQYAAGLTNPGDTVLVMDGTYTNDAPGDNILFVSRSGAASAPIVFAAYPGQHPVLQYSDSWAAIRVSANYIVLDGFEIIGNAAQISPFYGFLHVFDLLNPVTNGDGIDVNQPASGVITHHVTIRNMLIHDIPGGGIAVDQSDYVTVQNNVIYDTSNWSPYGDSAISFYEAQDVDGNTGVKDIIAYNTAFDNVEFLPCSCQNFQVISDGNGIIVDDNLNSQGDGVAYGGRTLVAYNISYGNGGSGIHAFSSQHVDIVNNTAYDNNLTSSIDEGQIFSELGADVNIVNNILVAPAGKVITGSYGNAGAIVENYNVLWNLGGGLVPPSSMGSNDILADPLLSNAAVGDFSLLPGSPALGSAEPAALLDGVMPEAASMPISANRGAE